MARSVALVGPAAGRRWTVLATVSAALAALQLLVGGRWLGSWHFFATGSQVLLGPDPLAVYALHPDLQFGPLTLLVGVPVVLMPDPLGRIVITVVMAAVGLIVLQQIRRLVEPDDIAGSARWFAVCIAVLLAWNVLAVRYGHLDDALALLGAVIALRLQQSGMHVRAAIVVGLAIDCKPWIAPLAAILLAVPRGRRFLACVSLAAVVELAWLPFAFHPGSAAALHFTIPVELNASIRVLGLADARTPVWCRPAQLILGAALAALLVRRRRVRGVLLAIVAVRLLLDPGAHPYYDAGLLVGAAVFDVSAAVPAATTIALAFVMLPPVLLSGLVPLQGLLRLTGLVALVVLVLIDATRGRAQLREPPRRPLLASAGTL